MSAWHDPQLPEHPVLALGDLLCEATDALRDAIDTEAAAENAYRHTWATEYLKLSDAPATSRDKWANALADDDRAVYRFAEAATARARAKVDELRARLSAWQSYMRREESVT